MKKILFILILCNKMSFAQFIKADLKASGLTCSMCNLATQKQLQTLNFVDSIVPDLETNTFYIYFNQQHEIDFGLIKKKVEDAGFFVAALKVTYITKKGYRYFNNLLFTDKAVLFIDGYKEGKDTYLFKFIDEGFVTAKALKKYNKIKQIMGQPIKGKKESSEACLIPSDVKIYYVLAE
jgi:hypothetical protein